MIYPTLIHNKSMYTKNLKNYSPLYSDRMIYSPNVPIIRDDNGDLLDKFVTASFITSAAVNRRVSKVALIKDITINSAMETRIKKTTNPYKCNSGEEVSKPTKKNPAKICDWNVDGLFGDLGKGIFVYCKDKLRGETIFMPISWEADNKQ